jgi:flagellar protein FliS
MWTDVYLENRVLAADGVELIHLLYEHALVQLKLGRAALEADDVAGRSKAVSKVIAILGELEGSLNYDAGGSISSNLARLYQYMRRRLVEGNVKRQDAALAEVESLMGTLNEGWTSMRHTTAAPVPWQASGEHSPFGVQRQSEEDPAAHSWSA